MLTAKAHSPAAQFRFGTSDINQFFCTVQVSQGFVRVGDIIDGRQHLYFLIQGAALPVETGFE